jgi:hypothetical protein
MPLLLQPLVDRAEKYTHRNRNRTISAHHAEKVQQLVQLSRAKMQKNWEITIMTAVL